MKRRAVSDEPKPLTRDRLVRHAELYGVAEIYETAEAGDLNAEELGSVARRLRNIDKRWKLTRSQASDLATGLIRAGMPDKDILGPAPSADPPSAKRIPKRWIVKVSAGPMGSSMRAETHSKGPLPGRKRRAKQERRVPPRPAVQRPRKPKPPTCTGPSCPYLRAPVLEGRVYCMDCAQRVDSRAAKLRERAT